MGASWNSDGNAMATTESTEFLSDNIALKTTTNDSIGPQPPWTATLQPSSASNERSTREYKSILVALDHYVTPAICVLGCLGNVLNLIVLNRRSFRRSDGGKETSAHIGLTFLAVSDTLFCICLFPRCILGSTSAVFDDKSFEIYYQMYATGAITTFILVSTWIIVAMATMRYLAICYPLRARLVDGPKYSRMLFSLVMCCGILLNLPSFWQYQLVELPPDRYMVDLGYMDHTKQQGMIFIWLRVILGTFIPAFILMFCNFSLIRALQRSYKMRRRYHVSETASRSRNRITLMLVAVVSTFVLFVFPSELMDFCFEVIKNNKSKTEVFLMMRSVANLLQVLNFSLNFVMYCVINVHFRNATKALLSCGYSQSNARRDSVSRACSHYNHMRHMSLTQKTTIDTFV